MNNIKADLERKKEEAEEAAEEYSKRIDIEFEDPFRVRFTGIIDGFEARYQYHTHTITINDASTPDEEFGTAFIHEKMHERHASLAFGQPDSEFEIELDSAEKLHREMCREAMEEGDQPVYIEEYEDLNMIPGPQLTSTAHYSSGRSVEEILEMDEVDSVSSFQSDQDIVREQFPNLYARSQKFNDGAWMAASEVVSNFVDYHQCGWIDELPRSAMLKEVADTIRSNEGHGDDYTDDELAEYARDQFNYVVSLYDKVSGTGAEDRLAGRVVEATDNMFEDYDYWNGLPSVKDYVNSELNI